MIMTEETAEIAVATPELTPAPTPIPEPATALPEQNPNELMENITTPLVVELGRASLSVIAIGQLKEGNIVELNRNPTDPVDLVIAGKRVGKGELVEIEGELGVRVLSIVK